MSTPDPYWRIKDIFADALDKPPADRDAFAQAECAGDERLLEQVRALLASHDRAAAVVRTAAIDESRLPPFSAELPGAVIGPYTTRELIGEGGMGVVYKAEQRSPIQRFVALKLIKLGMDTRQVIARFETERQALALMSHPNVAAVYDAGATDAGRPYFVMEYVAGTPINSFCDRHKFTTRQRLTLFLQACEAIQHAHQKAIIHRDIKPGNILVTLVDDKPLVKVIDFGVAKATAQSVSERVAFTETGQLVGTPEYMSPEQAELNPLDVDTRTDIYSLGVVLYQLLAGALPFDSKSLRQAAYAQIQAIIREVDPPRPSTRLSSMHGHAAAEIAVSRGTPLNALEKELRGELEWIPMKAMRKDRSRRYHTANELAQDIRNYLEQKPLLAAPESRRYRLRKFLKRNRGAVASAAAIAFLLVAGIVATTLALLGQSRQRGIAEQQRAAALQQFAESERLASLALAVSAFQCDMLAGVNADGVSPDRLTILQVVTAAAKQLDAGKLKDQPLVEANVRTMIATTYRSLGRFSEAEVELRRAVELQLANLKSPHAGIARTVQSLALTLQELGKLPESESLMRDVLAMRRQVAPADEAEIASSLSELGSLLQVEGKFADAEANCREAVDLFRRNPAAERDLGLSLERLAWVLQIESKFAEAEPLSREAVAIARRILAPTDTDIVQSLNVLAVILARTGRASDAEPLFREILDLDRRNLAPGHPRIGQSASNLASALQEQGKLEESETLQREGLELRRNTLPAGHPYIAQSLANLSALLGKQQKFDDAESMAREALAIRRAAFPAGHPDIANGLENLGAILLDAKKFGDAEEAYREAVPIFKSKFGDEDVRVARATLGLGTSLAGMERWKDAEEHLLAAEKMLIAPKMPAGLHKQAVQELAALYDRWEKSEPGQGQAALAEQWRQKLESDRSR